MRLYTPDGIPVTHVSKRVEVLVGIDGVHMDAWRRLIIDEKESDFVIKWSTAELEVCQGDLVFYDPYGRCWLESELTPGMNAWAPNGSQIFSARTRDGRTIHIPPGSFFRTRDGRISFYPPESVEVFYDLHDNPWLESELELKP